MRNRFIIAIAFLFLLPPYSAHSMPHPCHFVLAHLPAEVRTMLSGNADEKFSLELFLKTYKQIINGLEKSDLEQLLQNPFNLQHPTDSIKYKDANLLALMGKRLDEIYQFSPNLLEQIKNKLNADILEALEFIQKGKIEIRVHKEVVKKALSDEIWKIHPQGVLSIAYSPTDQLLAAMAWNSDIHIWDTNTRKRIRKILDGSDRNGIVKFSPDGRFLAFSTFSNIQFRNPKTGSLVIGFFTDAAILSIAFSIDSKLIALGLSNHSVQIWDWQQNTRRKTMKGHSDSVLSVAISPDGKTLLSASQDNSIVLWDLKTSQQIKTFKGHQGDVFALDFSPDGKTFASASSDKTIRIWDLESGSELAKLKGHLKTILSIAYSPDGRTLASGSEDTTIRIWNVETGDPIKTLEGHSATITSVQFAPDGKTLASGSKDGSVRIWQMRGEDNEQP